MNQHRCQDHKRKFKGNQKTNHAEREPKQDTTKQQGRFFH